jgi:hypothetical protein
MDLRYGEMIRYGIGQGSLIYHYISDGNIYIPNLPSYIRIIPSGHALCNSTINPHDTFDNPPRAIFCSRCNKIKLSKIRKACCPECGNDLDFRLRWDNGSFFRHYKCNGCQAIWEDKELQIIYALEEDINTKAKENEI